MLLRRQAVLLGRHRRAFFAAALVVQALLFALRVVGFGVFVLFLHGISLCPGSATGKRGVVFY